MAVQITQNDIYWATIAYSKQWFSFDGIWSNKIAANGGKIEAKHVRTISHYYNVVRGIVKRGDSVEDEPAIKLANILNTEIANWPDLSTDQNFLTNGACWCHELVKAASSSLHGNQCSAITKLVWFIKPDGWTVFDDLAATGLGVQKKLKSIDRMKAFYAKLQKNDFTNLCERMKDAISKTPDPRMAKIPATRIIDLFLCNLSKLENQKTTDAEKVKDQNDRRLECQLFLELLPHGMSSELKKLASILALHDPDAKKLLS